MDVGLGLRYLVKGRLLKTVDRFGSCEGRKLGQEKGSGVLGHLEVDFHTKGENELLELFVSCKLQESSHCRTSYTLHYGTIHGIFGMQPFILFYYAFSS